MFHHFQLKVSCIFYTIHTSVQATGRGTLLTINYHVSIIGALHQLPLPFINLVGGPRYSMTVQVHVLSNMKRDAV